MFGVYPAPGEMPGAIPVLLLPLWEHSADAVAHCTCAVRRLPQSLHPQTQCLNILTKTHRTTHTHAVKTQCMCRVFSLQLLHFSRTEVWPPQAGGQVRLIFGHEELFFLFFFSFIRSFILSSFRFSLFHSFYFLIFLSFVHPFIYFLSFFRSFFL